MNLHSLFRPALVDSADKPGLDFQGTTWTFGQLEANANRLARRLLEAGIERGDRISVYMRNRPELILAYLAASKAGFIFTPINILYRSGEIAHILDDAEPKAILLDRAADEHVAPLAAERPGIRKIFAEEIADWIADANPAPLDGEPPVASDPMALVYTSGTTGRPKGATLTQANFAANAQSLVEAWRITSDDRMLLTLPLFHVHGLGNGLHTWLATGYRLRLMERFRKETIVDDFLDFQPTVFFGVPTMYERLMETPPEAAKEIGGFMRLFVSGSAPLPAATLERFQALFGHRILERYGMSETMMNTSNPYEGDRRAGSVGPPLPGITIRVCDPESGEEVPEGSIGEVQIQGPNVFSGYWRRSEATAEAFTDDGFFRSGDLGFLDADGYVTLQGRGKELIISSGFNVYPREVEEFLQTLPGVLEAAVVGMPDPLKGEAPAAFLVVEDGVDLDAVQDSCSGKLASFKIPKTFERVDALPRNALGKVQKHLLKTGA